MIYARAHDRTVSNDYYDAMLKIERKIITTFKDFDSNQINTIPKIIEKIERLFQKIPNEFNKNKAEEKLREMIHLLEEIEIS